MLADAGFDNVTVYDVPDDPLDSTDVARPSDKDHGLTGTAGRRVVSVSP